MGKKKERKVLIFDTTLRDGEQSPGVTLNSEKKLQIGFQLEEVAVDIIEAGFPASSPGDFRSVQKLARELKKVQVAALARATEGDIKIAWEAIQDAVNPRIHTFLATSEIHMKYKLKMTREQVLENVKKAVSYASSFCSNVEFSAEDASRSDLDFVCAVFETAIDAGACVVNFPDTTGYAAPEEFYRQISYVMKNTPNIKKAILSVHCHNDLGLATANTLAAIRAGAGQVECTVNGIGERAGNTAYEEVVMAMHARKDLYPYATSVVKEQITNTSRLVSRLTGMKPQPNKAIVGANAFLHEAGIHQDGVLKEKSTYEIIDPRVIGLYQSNLVLGKHSGRKAINTKLEELGYHLNNEQLKNVFDRFKNLCDKKEQIFEADLEAFAIEEVSDTPDYYKLKQFQVVSGKGVGIIPTSTMTIEVDGKDFSTAVMGIGSVDSAFKAVESIIKPKSELLTFEVSSITMGTDAQGEVIVRLRENGHKVTGFNANQDIMVAAAEAYLNALNKLWRLNKLKNKQ